jgi:hypothetical protein
MRDVDVAEMRNALAAMKREGERENARPSDYFAVRAEEFRRGVASRLRAADTLAGSVRPATPSYETLDKPFLIWAFRGGGATDMLSETHIEPLNSWARFLSSWEFSGDDYVGPHDEVVFYFFWQNDTGSDAVVNVESQLMLAGRASVFAESGLIWTPFWGTGTIGDGHIRIAAQLKLFEWWNQPPTQPLAQPSQDREVLDWSVSGGWAVLGSGDGKSEWVAGGYHVNYDRFFVPAGAVAVFEVSLNMFYGGQKGSGSLDCQTAQEKLICPYVQLEGLTAPLTVSG